MKSSFILNNDKNKTVVRNQSPGFQTPVMEEVTHTTEFDLVKAKNRDIMLDGVMITVRHEKIKVPMTVDVKHSFPYIKVQFELEGYSSYIPNKSNGLPVEIKSGHYNFFYLPEVKGTLHYKPVTRRSLELVVTEDYLRKAFRHDFDKITYRFGNALRACNPFKMLRSSKPIPNELRLIIDSIVACSYEKEIKEIYLESKVKEIFSYLFHELSKEDTCTSDKKELPENELEQIFLAEKLLQQSFNKNITIQELATQIGMSQSKLKRNFKTVFEEPIFTHLTNIRMEHAKKMLSEKANVYEVAYAVGYKNPQHFTTAFKKKLGYLPSNLK